MEHEVTPEMVRASVEQARVDSSLSMTAAHRCERIVRAALTKTVDRATLNASLPGHENPMQGGACGCPECEAAENVAMVNDGI